MNGYAFLAAGITFWLVFRAIVTFADARGWFE